MRLSSVRSVIHIASNAFSVLTPAQLFVKRSTDTSAALRPLVHERARKQ